MPTRTARTAWDGGFTDGSGQVELISSGVATLDVSWPKRIDEGNSDTTTPEELLGAAHASCYSMQFAHELEDKGGTPQSLEVTADVTFGQDPAGGFKISGVALTVRGEVEGIDEAAFKEAAESAKTGCPVSRALAGVEITLDAAMEKA